MFSNLVSKAIFCDTHILLKKMRIRKLFRRFDISAAIMLKKIPHPRKAYSGELFRRFDTSAARVAARAPEETTYRGNLSAEQQFLKQTLTIPITTKQVTASYMLNHTQIHQDH